jgi:signal transduction histidine kinase
MNRAQVNEMAKILEAEERRRGAPDRRLTTHEVLQTLFEERNTLLERQVAERSSDLERSQENVRSLSAKLDLVEQRERKQMAAELHDYLAQLLVLGHMKVGELKRLTLPPKGDAMVREVESVLHQALNYCRTLIAELNPPVLKEEGLTAGICSLGIEMRRYGLEVSVETDQVEDLAVSESAAVLLFRSVRELLINTVKHAAAKQATVRVTCDHELLQIIVRNEGGSDLAASTNGVAAGTDPPLSSGLGLLFIKERMKALNGRLDFDSVPNQGTTATLIVPRRNL